MPPISSIMGKVSQFAKGRLGVFSETFYALAWSTLTVGGEKTNILASGGIRGEVRLFHPERKVRIPVLVNLIPIILSSLIMGEQALL